MGVFKGIKPEILSEWDYEKNIIDPNTLSYGSFYKAWWICSKNHNHKWQARVTERTGRGNGCPYCAGQKVDDSNSLEALFPEIAKEWDYEKNAIGPDEVVAGSNKEVWWKCVKDPSHTWKARVYNRSNGYAKCPICPSLAVKYPEIAKEWDYEKNEISPYDIKAGSGIRVWWKCSKNPEHIWQSKVVERTGRGNGCPFCVGFKVNHTNSLASLYPEIAKDWHPLKNSLTPDEVSAWSNRKVWWQCKNNPKHIWETDICVRTKGSGCPFCKSSTSQYELRILTELRAIFDNVKHREKVNGLEIDVLIKDYNIGIELDGSYWHKNKIIQDKQKNLALAKLGIKIFRLRGFGLDKISRNDIIFEEGKDKIDPLLQLLQKIKSELSANSNECKKIEKYLEEKVYKNESEYRTLLDMLPGPIEGRSFAAINPELVEMWSLDNDFEPDQVSAFSNKRIKWQCQNDKNHTWIAEVNRVSKGARCPYCAGQRVDEKNCLGGVCPEIAKEWHPTKNNLTPNEVTKGSNKRVWWQCSKNKNHEWLAEISERTRGNAKCPLCPTLGVKRPEIAREWHPTKNKLTPFQVTTGSNYRAWWKCSKNAEHEWQTSVSNRNKGTGCPYCSGRVRLEKKVNKNENANIEV